MSGPVTIQAFSGSAALIHAGAEKSSLALAFAWPLAFGPDPEAGVCGPLTTPCWRPPSFVVPPGTADEGEDDEGDEAGAAGGIVAVGSLGPGRMG